MAGRVVGFEATVLPAGLSLDSPVVAAAVVVAIVLVAIVLGWLVSKLRSGPGGQFRDVIADHESISVLMHPNPDPDAMACALAVSELAAVTGTDATLQYPGQIRHQENRAFETVLDVSFDRVEALEELETEAVVLVDHNEPRGFPGAETLDPIAVVDHHPGGGEGTAFTDVRTDYGACSTIFAEYFRELDWQTADPDAPPDEQPDIDRLLPGGVATGLLYGILTDTKQLTKGCSPAEFRAAEYLYSGVDQDQLDRIANPQVDTEVLDVKARAIRHLTVDNAYGVSDVGVVNNADAIPQAADELSRLEGVTAVVVYGEKDGVVYLSGRSRDDRVHMGNVLEYALEDIPMAEAGGHARMGGAQVSVEYMEGLGPSEGTQRNELAQLLFDAMSGDV